MKMYLLVVEQKSLIVLMLLSSYSHSVVSAPAPASSNVLSQISSSMSHSAVNSNNIIINSNNVTSSVISSAQLKEEIKETAAELGLEVDENDNKTLVYIDRSKNVEFRENIQKVKLIGMIKR